MSDIQTWSNTASSNNASPPNGFPEGMAPSTVNDAAREVMAAISRYRSDTDGVNTSAGTNTITLAASRTMTAYAQGDLYTFKAGGTNTGATTLNVDSLGAKDVQFNGAALAGGEIVSGLMYTAVYDGTQFQLLNASAIPAIDITTLEVTNIKAKDGTASATIANSTGVMTIASSVLTTSDINGGTIDNAVIGATTPVAGSFTNINLAGEWPTSGIIESRTISTNKPSAYSYSTTGFTLVGGATLINQYGYRAINLTQATFNYGFYADITASGADRYQFYAAGTAPSYFGGETTFALGLTSTGTTTLSSNAIVSVTDNTNAALRVTQLGTGNSLEIEDSTNPDVSPFIVNNAGQLIQGYTTAVASKVITTAATSANQIQGNTVGNSSLGVFSWSNNASFSSSLVFNKSKSGTIGTLSAVTSGDNLGIIQFNGSDNDASPTFNVGALISAQVAGTVATTSIPSRLNFSVTDNGGTSATLRMSLSPEGYLALGSAFTSPQQMLDIRANNTGLTGDAPLNVIRFTDADTTTAANQPIGKIEFYNSDTTNAAVGAYILSSSVGVDGGGTIRFGAAANAATAAEVCRVADTGFTMTKDTAGIGYGTGTGGAVTQATSRTTGVTLNKTNGAITLVSAAGTATWQSFTVTNSTVAATDVVVLSQKSGTDLYIMHVTAVAAGSFRISFATTGGTTTEQPVFNFAVIKAVAA
jgi:hypothetical protein